MKPYSFMAEKQIACNEIERERERERESARERVRELRERENHENVSLMIIIMYDLCISYKAIDEKKMKM